jgi:hypothetical protein
MGQIRVLTDVLDVVLLETFWACLLFPVLIGVFWKWWQSSFGISYMAKVILLALALSPAAAHRMFGIPVTSAGYGWYVVASIGLITPVLAWRGWLLWREQRADRSKNPVTAVREWLAERRHGQGRREKETA